MKKKKIKLLLSFYKYDLTIFVICLLAIFLLIKSTDYNYIFDCEWLKIFKKFKLGNDIYFNISIGYIVSTIFYIVNIFLPKLETLVKYNELISWNVQVIYKKLAKIFIMILNEEDIVKVQSCNEESLKKNIKTIDPCMRYEYEGVINNINKEIFECYGLVLKHIEYLVELHSIIPVELLKILFKIKAPILMLNMSIIKNANKDNFQNFQNDLISLHSLFKELALFKEVFIDKKTKQTFC